MQFYTYLLKCRDNTLYCGYTNNLKQRLEKHQKGKAAKYTKTRLPVKLVYAETHKTKSEAMKQEYRIKQLNKIQKLQLIKSQNL